MAIQNTIHTTGRTTASSVMSFLGVPVTTRFPMGLKALAIFALVVLMVGSLFVSTLVTPSLVALVLTLAATLACGPVWVMLTRLTVSRSGLTYGAVFKRSIAWDDVVHIQYDALLHLAVLSTHDGRKLRLPKGLEGAYFIESVLRQLQFETEPVASEPIAVVVPPAGHRTPASVAGTHAIQ